ncbi:MAG TPA: SdiA-regulated domain-containing protein [Lutibacter sp.]
MKFSLTFIIFSLLLSCQAQPKVTFDECKSYDLKQPSVVWEMPSVLDEISGIEILAHQKVICHNDEHGNLFVYDLNNKTIEITIPFAEAGDYEDVAIKGSTAFVLRSDGTIFEVQNYLNSPKTIKHKTFLTQQDNTEGLFFDVDKNRLLVASKSNSGKKDGKGKRFVYEYLLSENALNPTPVLTILQKEIQKTYHVKSQFSPSGIAIHPITKNIYILSSVGKMLAEFSSDGDLQKIYSLNYPHFMQPEGISFTENGDLYISNETKRYNANILKFNFIP